MDTKKRRIIFSIILLVTSLVILIFKEPKIDTFIEGIKAIVVATGGSILLMRGYRKISNKLYSALSYRKKVNKYVAACAWLMYVMNCVLCLRILFGDDYFADFFMQSVTVGMYVGIETSKKDVEKL